MYPTQVVTVHQRPMPESITCAGETTWHSQDPVISGGRREARDTAAPVPPQKVSADGVGTTWWGVLRTFIYIWTQKELGVTNSPHA